MLEYDMPLYRPPSEGENLIIQATIGCSFNQCSFCSMYKQKKYQARKIEDIYSDINSAKTQFPETKRVFLADGDALTLATEDLLKILKQLNSSFPKLTRISCYATPANILHKSEDDLRLLRQHKLNLLYLGIESGSDILLKKITKGATQRGIIESMHKAYTCNIKVSGTIILGLGGTHYWQEHIDKTAELINAAPISYLSTLQLFLDESAYSEFNKKFREPFIFQNDQGILLELKTLIARIAPPRPVIFRSNHASNALALAGNLPKDQKKLLGQIENSINGQHPLRPDYLRSL